MKDDLEMLIDESHRKVRKEMVAIGGAGGTTTANLPTDTLVAPSTPKSRGDDEPDRRKKKSESETEGVTLGIVRRVFPNPISGVQVAEVSCPGCNEVGEFEPAVGDQTCFHCGLGFVVHENQILAIGEGIEIQAGELPDHVLKVAPVRQTTSYCGPAALTAVLNFFGSHTTELEVAKAADSSHVEGTTAQGLMRAAESFGMKVGYRDNGTSEDLKRLVQQEKVPVLIFWYGHGRKGDGAHASVIVGMDEKNVYMMDPEPGLVVPKLWTKFLASWFSFADGIPSTESLKVGEFLTIKPW